MHSCGPIANWITLSIELQIVEFEQLHEYFGELRDAQIVEHLIALGSQQIEHHTAALLERYRVLCALECTCESCLEHIAYRAKRPKLVL